MRYELRYSSGRRERQWTSEPEAVEAVEAMHSGCVIHDEWEPRGIGSSRKLVWASQADADTNGGDDGSQAIAEIIRHDDE